MGPTCPGPPFFPALENEPLRAIPFHLESDDDLLKCDEYCLLRLVHFKSARSDVIPKPVQG